MLFRVNLPRLCSPLGVRLVIKFDEGQGMDLIGVFPGVVTFEVAFPFDQIL
jgi:hypothetical protein